MTVAAGSGNLSSVPYAERLQIKFTRTPAGYTEDVATINMHFTTPSESPLGDTIRASVESAFQTLWTTLKSDTGTHTSLTEFRWYNQLVWPTPSPLLRTQTITAVPGTGANPGIPQWACSATLQTAHRKRWGRVYFPSFYAPTGTTGRFTSAKVDSVATAWQTFVQAAKTAGALPCVWSPKGGVGPPAFAAGTYEVVTSVRVDDIPDVVRSRRWQSSPYRKILVIT